MTTTLGLIGTGMIGGTLARLAVSAGLNVVLSNSRGPDSLADLVAELGPQARAAAPTEADLVVATIPLGSYDKLSADDLAGKIVIDTMNYYPQRDGRLARLDADEVTSSQPVQEHLAGSRVVKAFNNINFVNLGNLVRPAGTDDRSALPVAGDDPAANARVAGLLDVLGYDTVDIGELAGSWRSEPGMPVYVEPYSAGPPPAGLGRDEAYQWFLTTPGVPVPAARVRELIDSAVRGPAGGSFVAA